MKLEKKELLNQVMILSFPIALLLDFIAENIKKKHSKYHCKLLLL